MNKKEKQWIKENIEAEYKTSMNMCLKIDFFEVTLYNV